MVPDLVHTFLQPPSSLIFLPVFLTLQRPNPNGGLLRDGGVKTDFEYPSLELRTKEKEPKLKEDRKSTEEKF